MRICPRNNDRAESLSVRHHSHDWILQDKKAQVTPQCQHRILLKLTRVQMLRPVACRGSTLASLEASANVAGQGTEVPA